MKSVSYRLEDFDSKKKIIIPIGFVGENEFRQVNVDCHSVLKDHPNAVVTSVVTPPKGDPYPGTLTRAGEIVTWTISASDVIYDGYGEIQFTFTDGEKIGKTWGARTKIEASAAGNGEIPTPIQNWIDQANEKLADVEEAKDAAQAAATEIDNMTVSASGTAYGTEPTATVSEVDEHKHIAFTIPAGQPGADGHTPVKGTDYWTEQDKQGIVSDVVDTMIDDTTPSNEKTFSSSKVDQELTDVKTAIQGKPDQDTSTETGVDLDISDENGNVILRMKNGEVQTKKFNSAYASGTKQSDKSGADMDISDESGNVIARFKKGHIVTKNFNSAKYGAKVITLKADGSGDFSTLKAALDSITDADPDTNPYEIHIYPGTYNTLEGFTDEEIRSADIGGGYTDDSMVGAKTKDGVSIIGIGERERIILTAELSTSDYGSSIRGNISTLNMAGTGRLENLTIIAKNLRYCVHDDFSCTHIYERIVKNCAFRGTNLAYDPPTTYGAGIAYGGMIALYENCDFGYDWGLHTRQIMKVDSIIELRNCTGNILRIGDFSNNDDAAHHQYIVNNCNFLRLYYSKSNGTIPHIHVSGCGNERMMIDAPAAVVAEMGNIIKTKTASLPVGTMVGLASGASYMSKAASVETAIGIIIASDSNYDYVQTEGFIKSDKLSLSGLSIGDYVTVDSDMIVTSGGTASNAVGVVKYVDSSSNAYIWML